MAENKKVSFKEYYATHPEFKAQHVANMAELVHCDACNKYIARGHFVRHFKTNKHIKNATEKGFVYENEFKTRIKLKQNIKNKTNSLADNITELKRFEKYVAEFN